MPRLTETPTPKTTAPAGSAKAPKAPKLAKAATARKAAGKTPGKAAGIKTLKAAPHRQEREMGTATTAYWTPDMIRDAIETVEVEAPDTLAAFGPKAAAGAGEPDPVLAQGPDASQREIFSDDPRMIEARAWLSDLIANPPRYPDGSVGSIRLPIDKWRAAAMRERNVGHNRKRKPKLIRHLVGLLKRGEWSENGQTVGFDWNGEMINGQNRSEAIYLADVAPVWLDVRFGLPPDSFKHMDNGAPRTNADVLQISGHTNVNALAAAIRMMYRYELSPSMRDIDGISPDQAEETLKRHPELKEGVSMQARFRKGGLTSGAAGAVFWSLAVRHNRFKAEAFVRKFETGLGIMDESDVVFKARSYFGNLRGNRRASPEQMLSIMIKAFNAFAKGQNPKGIRALAKGDLFPQILPPDPTVEHDDGLLDDLDE